MHSITNSKAYDLRLVHHAGSGANKSSCQFNSTLVSQQGCILLDLHLSMCLGADGLMRLLSFLAKQELPQDQVLEMIKRLHIPGYEHARHYFKKAINQFVIEPNMPPGFYCQNQIDAVLEWSRSINQDA